MKEYIGFFVACSLQTLQKKSLKGKNEHPTHLPDESCRNEAHSVGYPDFRVERGEGH